MKLFGRGAADRARAEKLCDRESKMAAFSRSQALIEFNLDGTIIDANSNFLKTMGYGLEEVKGRHHRTFVETKEAESPEYKAFWEELNNGQFVAGKFRRLAKGGREVWLQAAYNPMVQQATAAAANLKSDAEGLARTVARFRTEALRTISPLEPAGPGRHVQARNPVARNPVVQAQARAAAFADELLTQEAVNS